MSTPPAFPKVPNYEPYIDELLKMAGAKPRARADLADSLESARRDIYLARIKQARPPPSLLEQLENHLAQTVRLLERLEKYPSWNHVSFETYVAGGGIADAFTTQELFKKALAAVSLLPRKPKPSYGPQNLPSDGKLVAVNVNEVLRSVKHKIKHQQKKPPRGGQRKEDQADSVSYAKNFFVRHSPHKPSTDPKNNFAEFCRLFFRAVSGADAPSGLDWHIREALKD